MTWVVWSYDMLINKQKKEYFKTGTEVLVTLVTGVKYIVKIDAHDDLFIYGEVNVGLDKYTLSRLGVSNNSDWTEGDKSIAISIRNIVTVEYKE